MRPPKASALLLGFLGIVAAALTTQFNRLLVDNGWEIYAAAGAATVVGATAFMLSEHAIRNVFPKWRWLRPFLVAEYRFEGRWIETINAEGERLYTLMTITASDGAVKLGGITYDAQGVPKTDWESSGLSSVETGLGKIRFEYYGTLRSGDLHRVGGIAELRFCG